MRALIDHDGTLQECRLRPHQGYRSHRRQHIVECRFSATAPDIPIAPQPGCGGVQEPNKAGISFAFGQRHSKRPESRPVFTGQGAHAHGTINRGFLGDVGMNPFQRSFSNERLSPRMCNQIVRIDGGPIRATSAPRVQAFRIRALSTGGFHGRGFAPI